MNKLKGMPFNPPPTTFSLHSQTVSLSESGIFNFGESLGKNCYPPCSSLSWAFSKHPFNISLQLKIVFLPPLVPLYMYPSLYLLVGGWGLSPLAPPLHLTLGPPPIQTQHSRGSAPWPGHCPPKNIKKQPSMLYDKLQTRTS